MGYERRASASKGRVFERKKSAFDLFLHKCVKCHSFGGKGKRFLQEEEESESSKTIFRGQM